jgi:hypothetical protein
MQVAEGGIPLKNKIVDPKITEGLKRSEEVKKAKTKLDWVKGWIVAKDRWC